MSNRLVLRELLLDILLLEEEEFSFDLRREDVTTWDSLGVVSIAVGLQETFGYHPTPEEAVSLDSIAAIINLLEQKGIPCGP